MRFESPWWLVVVPVVVLLIWYRERPRNRSAVLFSSVDDLRALPRTLALRVKRALPLLEGAGLVLLVLAMARPQTGRQDSIVASEGIAIQMVVDRSGSMRQLDIDPDPTDRIPVTRLDMVKTVVRDFVDEEGDLTGRPTDVIGRISFAGYVQVHCPLTLDHEAFVKLVEGLALVPRNAGREMQMTAVGDALVTAVDRLSDIAAQSKVVILLSDGESNIGEASPKAAAELARSHGVKVYTIGIGTPLRGLDEATLEEVATLTGGQYFNARNAEGLMRIYHEIDKMERVDLPPIRFVHWKEHFILVLLSGAACLLFHRVLADTRFRTLP